MKKHRRCFVVLACACAIGVAAARLSSQAGVLTVERQGDHLRLFAPHFHFLEDGPLDRLHDGAALTYAFSVSVDAERGSARWPHLEERFVISYDLWEETLLGGAGRDDPKIRIAPDRGGRRGVVRRPPALPVRAAPADKTFVVKLRMLGSAKRTLGRRRAVGHDVDRP